MKNMRKKHRVKEKQQQSESSSGSKVYGCEMPKDLNEEIEEHPKYELHSMYKEYLIHSKSNSFGLGYIGLREHQVSNKVFTASSLTVHEGGMKKLSISGQAFGVGAFEEDDEDIYVKEDMSKYDYELTGEGQTKKAEGCTAEKLILGMFVVSKGRGMTLEKFPPPIIPASFSGKHNVRKSRFEPFQTPSPEFAQRNEINASIRAKYLGQPSSESTLNINQSEGNKVGPSSKDNNKIESYKRKTEELKSASETLSKSFESSRLIFDKFVSASQTEDVSNILEEVKPSGYIHGTQEMQDAARMKMFGPLTRVIISWTPSSLLCKRFNVPEPNSRYVSFQYGSQFWKIIFNDGR